MADTGTPLNIILMEVGQAAKETTFNNAMAIVNNFAGGSGGAGLNAKNACRVATTAGLTVTYANGTAGVGATLTNAGAQAALAIDGVTLAVNDRVLVKDQASAFQNGLYTVTNVGSGSTNWVMTRATDFDNNPAGEVALGAYTAVVQGTVNALMLYLQTAAGPFTIGTTAITFSALANYTDEMAQDAIGAMIDASLTYVDATPLLQRAALTGDVTAAAGSNATVFVAASQQFAWTGDISPAQITANQNDYNPAGLATAAILRLSTDASRDLTGIVGGTDGRILLLLNVGSFPLVLKDDVTSTAANRFQLSSDVTLAAEEGALLWYDSTSSRWRLAGIYQMLVAASETVAGKVELATATETTTGTDATRAVTPDGLAGSDFGRTIIGILVSDPLGDAITVGDGKAYVRIPSTLNGQNLVAVAAHVSTASTSGIPTIQIRNVTQAADMLTTRITIDANEKDSLTAATAAVIDTANDDVATGDEVAIDIDVAGTGTKGLFVELQFQLP